MSPPAFRQAATSSAQYQSSPVVVRGYTIERNMPTELNGFPT